MKVFPTWKDDVAEELECVGRPGKVWEMCRVVTLCLEVLGHFHDHKTAGHPGIRRTIKLIQRRFFWPKMRQTVTSYVRTCLACAQAKSHRHKPYGLLKFLPIPARPWSSISMDFIEGLPSLEGYNTILAVVCQLTKQAIFIECKSTDDTPRFAELFLKHVFSKHGLPTDIISDRGKLFVSKFWTSLCKLLDVRCNLSTAYHPETDGQTERVNSIIELYIRMYCNYAQDDWVPLLPLGEFAYNNAPHSATGVSPFFANKAYHPTLEVGIDNVPSVAAQQYAEDLADLHEYLKEQLRITISQYEQATKNRRIPLPEFPIGSKVWLNAKNIKTKRPAKKFDHKNLGPFEVLEKISSHAYRLRLPNSMKVLHPVFSINLLEPFQENTIPNRRQPPPPPVEVEGEEEYEVSAVLDSQKIRNKIEYLVEWIGYEESPDHRTWEPVENLVHAKEFVRDFHRRYPDKPKPQNIF